MAKHRWVYVNGEAVEVDIAYVAEPRPGAPAVSGDTASFQSPIDGKWYHGRKGMREHCAKHDVVPTAELKGLAPKPAHTPPPVDKHRIHYEMRKRGLL
jgi:hypothetical protein